MKKIVLLSLLFVLPTVASAAVEISEVMYDLSGTDSDHEWIEIYNSGAAAVDLTGWKLFEADTNHGMTLISGSATLAAGAYAIIADNSNVFSSDWPSFTGALFDSAFSLSNTGETLVLRDTALADVDSVTYSSSQGAAGDGNSLQKSGSSWVAQLPTPGATASGSGGGGGTATSSPTTQETGSLGAPPPANVDLKISITASRQVVAGVPIKFSAKVSNLSGPVSFYWNFGDGQTGYGDDVFKTFYFPGDYLVTVRGLTGNGSGRATVTVKAVAPTVEISQVVGGENGYFELHNLSSTDTDISGWQVSGENVFFVIPEDTTIRAGARVIMPSVITRMRLKDGQMLALANPSGRYIATAAEVQQTFSQLAQENTQSKQAAQQLQEKVVQLESKIALLQKPRPKVAGVAVQKIVEPHAPQPESVPVVTVELPKKLNLWQKLLGWLRGR